MIFSNLRMIWYSIANIKINLSIGYDCIIGYDIKSIETKASGNKLKILWSFQIKNMMIY